MVCRQTLSSRTRIRLPEGAHWLSIPVKKKESGTPLAEIEIDHSYAWVQDHLKGLQYNYATAPYYDHFEPSLRALLTGDYRLLHELTTETVKWMVTAFGISTPMVPSGVDLDGTTPANGPDTESKAQEVAPVYRQNFPGFVPGVGALDLLLNHGPSSISYLP